MRPAPVVPRLLTQVRQAIRLHQYSRRTEEAYLGWVRRYVRFSGMRHPAELGGEDVRRFLTALADRGKVSASTQSQALSGLLFLYRQVLGRELDPVAIVRPARPVRRGWSHSCYTAVASGCSRRWGCGSRIWTSARGSWWYGEAKAARTGSR